MDQEGIGQIGKGLQLLDRGTGGISRVLQIDRLSFHGIVDQRGPGDTSSADVV